ncbi:MAG: flagellar protein FlbB [Spirochaetales bacterium]|nr:flagellar protein FlbB [Spirochaetales bacterium]
MPEYSTIPVSLRIFVLLLIIFLLIILGFIVLSSLGIIDTRGLLAPFYRLVGISTQTEIDVDDPLLLVHQREKKNTDALLLWEEELALKEKEISERESDIKQTEERLTEEEKALQEAEKTIKEGTKDFDDRRRRLEQKSEQLLSMPPENAVKIMLAMDDMEVIEVLRVTEELAVQNNELSIVPYWISLMPPERAADIQRKWR